MSIDRDIVVTWPKSKPLGSYLADLAIAKARDLFINYRVSRLPVWRQAMDDHGWLGWPYGAEHPRCYMVHDGAVRGWCEVVGARFRKAGEVTGWPAGFYVVRSPEWHDVALPLRMAGFRGWRYFERYRRDPAG